jgi:hypothetical protein
MSKNNRTKSKPQVGCVLDRETVERIDELSNYMGRSRSQMMATLLEMGLEHAELNLGMWGALEDRLPYLEMTHLQVAREEGIPLPPSGRFEDFPWLAQMRIRQILRQNFQKRDVLYDAAERFKDPKARADYVREEHEKLDRQFAEEGTIPSEVPDVIENIACREVVFVTDENDEYLLSGHSLNSVGEGGPVTLKWAGIAEGYQFMETEDDGVWGWDFAIMIRDVDGRRWGVPWKLVRIVDHEEYEQVLKSLRG